jgi:hypothetical protein
MLIAFFHGKAGVAPTPLGLPQEVANRQGTTDGLCEKKAIGTRQQPTPPQRDQKAAKRRRNQRNAGKTPTPRSPGPLFYAIVALVAFLLGFMILGVMLWNAQLLVSLGLTEFLLRFTPGLRLVGRDSSLWGASVPRGVSRQHRLGASGAWRRNCWLRPGGCRRLLLRAQSFAFCYHRLCPR